MKDTTFSSNFSLNFKGILRVYKHPIVMGIINATPDSFYDKSRHQSLKSSINTARQMIIEGAEILDIGGYSSRPGAEHISESEETTRVIPIIESIKSEFPNQIVSIDTFRTSVAAEAINAGADMINDISGGFDNPEIYELSAKNKTPYVMMHMKGNPQNMQFKAQYNNLFSELIHYFSTQIDVARKFGLKDIIIDPGIGFSKTVDQNYQLIKDLHNFSILNCPLLIGISRKSLINKLLDITPKEALNATTSLNTVSLMNGANILRVHDVKEAVEAVKIFSKVFH